MLQWRQFFSASLNGGIPSSGVRLGDIGVGDLGTLASLTLAGMPQNHRTFRTLHTSEGMTMNLANHTQQVSGENPL
jgi:hypothetical protein